MNKIIRDVRGDVCDECDNPLPFGCDLKDCLLPMTNGDYKIVCPGECRRIAEERMKCQK